MPSVAARLLCDVVCARRDDGLRTWLADVLARAAAGEREALYAAYTAAPRKAGRDPLRLTPAERLQMDVTTPDNSFDTWTCEDALRAVLLLSLAEDVSPDDLVVIGMECYERGDSREQQSWLKGLPLMPRAERFLPAAVDACRTNIVPLFEAIACDNPYPARHFPDLHFNQLVMKSMFMGVSLSRVVGLERRVNAELSRMARDFAAERRAAGRPVPTDLALALTTNTRTEGQPR